MCFNCFMYLFIFRIYLFICVFLHCNVRYVNMTITPVCFLTSVSFSFFYNISRYCVVNKTRDKIKLCH